VEVCRRYQPEQVLLSSATDRSEWKDLLEAQYSLAYQDDKHLLYLSKGLGAPAIGQAAEQ
jgi:hypothetical protein